MKIFLIISSVLVLFVSCLIVFPPGELNYRDTLLEDQFVVSLAIEDDGTAWAGIIRDQYGLIKINTDGSTEIFDHTNSCLHDSSNIWDMDIDSQGRVWMLNDDGLVCYDGDTFMRYDSLDDGYIPRAHENFLEIDNNDKIWFIGYNIYVNCPAQKIFCFDGSDFTSYVPNGTGMDQSYSYTDIKVDNSGNVWFSFNRGDPVFLKYDGSEWTSYDSSDIGFAPYKVSDIEFDSDNNLWFNDDYTFSSIAYNKQPSLYVFDGQNEAVPFGENHFISEISVDADDNIWICGLVPRLGVLDVNQKWVTDNSDNIGYCRVMEMDPNGDMWLGTSEGIKVYRYCQTK